MVLRLIITVLTLILVLWTQPCGISYASTCVNTYNPPCMIKPNSFFWGKDLKWWYFLWQTRAAIVLHDTFKFRQKSAQTLKSNHSVISSLKRLCYVTLHFFVPPHLTLSVICFVTSRNGDIFAVIWYNVWHTVNTEKFYFSTSWFCRLWFIFWCTTCKDGKIRVE